MKRTQYPCATVEHLEDRVFMSVSPGLQGYEGQPGNQGGDNHNGADQNKGTPNGLKGYEGQPGNQGNN